MCKLISKKESTIFIVATFLYLLNKFWMSRYVAVPFMQSYFNDVMGGCVFGILLRVNNRFWFRKEILFRTYFLLSLAASCYWEYVAPLYLSSSVQDVWDIFAYMGGAVGIWLFLERRIVDKVIKLFHSKK